MFAHQLKKLFLVLRLHRRQREAEIILAPAHGGHGGLDGDGVDLAEQRVNERKVIQLHLQAARDVAVEPAVAHLARLARHEVRQYGDDARAARGEDRRVILFLHHMKCLIMLELILFIMTQEQQFLTVQLQLR